MKFDKNKVDNLKKNDFFFTITIPTDNERCINVSVYKFRRKYKGKDGSYIIHGNYFSEHYCCKIRVYKIDASESFRLGDVGGSPVVVVTSVEEVISAIKDVMSSYVNVMFGMAESAIDKGDYDSAQTFFDYIHMLKDDLMTFEISELSNEIGRMGYFTDKETVNLFSFCKFHYAERWPSL